MWPLTPHLVDGCSRCVDWLYHVVKDIWYSTRRKRIYACSRSYHVGGVGDDWIIIAKGDIWFWPGCETDRGMRAGRTSVFVRSFYSPNVWVHLILRDISIYGRDVKIEISNSILHPRSVPVPCVTSKSHRFGRRFGSGRGRLTMSWQKPQILPHVLLRTKYPQRKLEKHQYDHPNASAKFCGHKKGEDAQIKGEG